MDSHNSEKASDHTEDQGSGSTVAETTGVSQTIFGTNDDELANPQEVIRKIEIHVPFTTSVVNGTLQPMSKCSICIERGRNLMFLKEQDLVKHISETHNEYEIEIICICGRKPRSMQHWHAHKWRCNGNRSPREREPSVSTYNCSQCDFSCQTKSGLGQHERHRHPDSRNTKRRKELEPSGNKGGRKNYVWTEESTRLLRTLSERYQDERAPIEKILPELISRNVNMTKRQVQDKLRRLSLADARRHSEQADDQRQTNTNVSRAESISSEASDDVFFDTIETLHEPQDSTTPPSPIETTVVVEPVNEPSDISIVIQDIEEDRQGEVGRTGLRVLREINLETQVDTEVYLEPEQDQAQDVWINEMTVFINSRELKETDKYQRMAIKLRHEWQINRSNKKRTQEFIDTFVAQEINPLLTNSLEKDKIKTKRQNPDKRQKTDRNDKQNTKPKNHTQRKRYAFARCQELYNKCPRKLAEYTVKGDFSFAESRQDLPQTENIKKVYEALWGEKTTDKVDLPDQEINQVDIRTAIKPITVKDIRQRISATKNDSAAGGDGIKKTHIARTGVGELLEILYNILILEGMYPEAWKSNRTTLIPKPGKDLTDVKNWRPITVGSMLARIYSALIDAKMRSFIQQSGRQKGFTSEDGCRQNILILEQTLDEMKMGENGVVTILDVSKAFDTVPHCAIEPALRRKGVPDHIVKSICEMYNGCKTRIKGADGTLDITLERGVKQGDPLSPLIFNLAIDPLLDKLSRETRGAKVGDSQVATLAFADDLVLLSRDKEEAQKQLDIVQTYLKGLGMSLAANKCQSFRITAKRKTWFMDNPQLKVEGVEIPQVEADEAVTYLGGKISPWVGLTKGQEVRDVEQVIKNTKKLNLKPNQKVELLKMYILPRFVYRLTVNPPSSGVLQMLDSTIRQAVKEILHLPLSTATGFFYTPMNQGGLGLMKFERVIQLAALKTSTKTQRSRDEVMRVVSQKAKLQKYYDKCTQQLRVTRPQSPEECDNLKGELKKQDTDSWSKLKLQGQGVETFRRDNIGNKWLSQSGLLSSSRYLTALRLRTNTFGTKVVLAQATKTDNVLCRRCNTQNETLGHILGICTHTKPARIRRHSEIRDFIADKAGKKYQVLLEPSMRVTNELKKPDLIIYKQDSIIVADVTVVYESGNYIKTAAMKKRDKYQSLANLLGSETDKDDKVLPIVVGCRGALPKKTVEALKELNLSKADLLTVSMIALRTSIEIANGFIDYNQEIQ